MRGNSTEPCPLCGHGGEVFFRTNRRWYYRCTECAGIFLPAQFLPTAREELLRYRRHNNDVHDPSYRAFVSPITDSVLKDFSPEHSGLDFGAGPGPVISAILHEQGYSIEQYDPFFHHDPSLLTKQYDYIVCCEVMEHFHNPKKEFTLLLSLLQSNGILYCMTDLYRHDIDFDNWYYKNDPTHVFIYCDTTIRWVAERCAFSRCTIDGRLIRFFR